MRLALWAIESALAGLAAYAVAFTVARDRGLLDRLIITIIVCTASVLFVLYACGLFNAIAVLPVATLALAVHGAMTAIAVRRTDLRSILDQLSQDARAPIRLLRNIYARHELAAWALIPASFALAISALIIWRFPSWSWDCVWYHVPISNYIVQQGSTGWIPTSIPWINSFPRHLELLSVWNNVFVGHTKLDDLPQLPFALLGGLTTAAFCRRFGASPALSASAGAMWIVTPAVFLQIHTTHADIAAAALFIAGWYFISDREFSRCARCAAFLSLGLYAGTKLTGLSHLILLSPILVARTLWQAHRNKWPRSWAWEVLGLFALCTVAIGPIYFRNISRFANPLWPARIQVPLTGWALEGPIDAGAIADRPSLFRGTNTFKYMFANWYTPSQNYYPDVREGPFGFLFPWLTLPLLIFATVIALFFKPSRWDMLFVAGMGWVSVLVPTPWWGRFTLGLPAAALIGFAYVHTRLRTPVLQLPLSGAAALLTMASFTHAFNGYRVLPRLFADRQQQRVDEARLRSEMNWLWPPDAAALRDSELRAGDVVAYDRSTSFLAELWTPDLRNRVVYVEYEGDDDAYLQALRAAHPRWVSVGRGSAAEGLLRRHPDVFEFLFSQPRSEAQMYRIQQAAGW